VENNYTTGKIFFFIETISIVNYFPQKFKEEL